MPASPPVIRLDHLAFRIDDRPILRDFSARIGAGEFVALLGSNGAGKTTLLKILALLRSPSSGTLELFGKPAHRQAHDLRRRIGLIGHQSMLYGELSVRENLRFFGQLYGLRDLAARTDQLLDTLGLLDRRHDAVKTFSRGMLQRASIARALLHDPDLLLADEPFTGLDAPSAQSLEALLSNLHRVGKTIIIVHHDLSHALRLAGRAIVLNRGGIAIDQPTSSLSAERIIEQLTPEGRR